MPMSSLMASSASPTLVLGPQFKDEKGALIFDANVLQKQPNVPNEFVWPSDLASTTQEELNEPLIDLSGFIRGDEAATALAVELARKACLKHGFFQVTNHGIDKDLIRSAYDEVDSIFKLPLTKKLSVRRKPGQATGYSGAHADRYSSNLPWKETFSFDYHFSGNHTKSEVVDYFKSALGEDLEDAGRVYQRYCEAMKDLSLLIMELLAISLGVDRLHFRKFFEDGSSLMRCNSYPPCNSSSLTLGTGPHSDPISLTILHQDQVGGLEVFADNKWLAVRPRPEAFVINLGDTFMALSNGVYKSCLHRALVNSDKERKSLVFFVSPRADKTVRPPEELLGRNEPRKYPDFAWSELFEFTQKHSRVDVGVPTLPSFIQWLRSATPSSSF